MSMSVETAVRVVSYNLLTPNYSTPEQLPVCVCVCVMYVCVCVARVPPYPLRGYATRTLTQTAPPPSLLRNTPRSSSPRTF
jgi:hypothetical protein